MSESAAMKTEVYSGLVAWATAQLMASIVEVRVLMITFIILCIEALCNKGSRGGTKVSVNATCDEQRKKKTIIWKVALMLPKKDENQIKGKEKEKRREVRRCTR